MDVRDNKGLALVLVLLFLTLVTTFSTTLVFTALLNYEQMRNLARSRQVFYAAEGGIELAYYLLLIKEEDESLFDSAEEILNNQLTYKIEEENHTITVYLYEDLSFSLIITIDEDQVILESIGQYCGYEDNRRIEALLERDGDSYSLISWQELEEY